MPWQIQLNPEIVNFNSTSQDVFVLISFCQKNYEPELQAHKIFAKNYRSTNNAHKMVVINTCSQFHHHFGGGFCQSCH